MRRRSADIFMHISWFILIGYRECRMHFDDTATALIPPVSHPSKRDILTCLFFAASQLRLVY
jgi:hypothetical protein